MTNKKWINRIVAVVLVGLTVSVPAVAQDNQSAHGQPANTQSRDNQEQGEPDVHIQADPRPGTADTPGAAEAAAKANQSDRDTTTQVSNTPAVVQTTSSSSGSPAVPAGNSGKQRDGTNTVQRATMNMAGSPAENLNLSEGQAVDPDTELADRQDRTQEKQVSAEAHSQGGNTAGESGEINNNTRKENNDLSDQNLSSKDKGNQPAVNEDRKRVQKKRKKEKG